MKFYRCKSMGEVNEPLPTYIEWVLILYELVEFSSAEVQVMLQDPPESYLPHANLTSLSFASYFADLCHVKYFRYIIETNGHFRVHVNDAQLQILRAVVLIFGAVQMNTEWRNVHALFKILCFARLFAM